MPILTEKFSDFKHGVVNAIEASDIPKEAMFKSQNMYYRENRWRKLPGLGQKNTTSMGAFNVRGIGKYFNIPTGQKEILAACGTDIWRLVDGITPTSVWAQNLEDDIEFLDFPPFLYFGSKLNKWRRYDGGTITYPVGGDNGSAADAPRKFSKIAYNDYSGRFFGIGEIENPDYLNFSEHVDRGGIEKWPDGNAQIVPSRQGDTPQHVDIYEGRIFIFNQNSMSSGNVSGVPESWSFQSERCQAGFIAPRSVKRYGNFFLGLTPDFEIYQWPNDKFITKGRVKFSINPYKAKFACAEIVEDRYYDICFESGEAVSSNKFHWWRYDILGDRWYGPSTQRNIVSMFYDKDDRVLLCGGADNFQGYVLPMMGRNIHTSAMKCHLVSSFANQGDIRYDKRYVMLRVKAKQTGSLSSGISGLELIVNTDQSYGYPQAQALVMEDPAGGIYAETGDVKDSIIKRAHIPEERGRGSSVQVEFKHELFNGDLEISEFEIDYFARTKKENRGV